MLNAEMMNDEISSSDNDARMLLSVKWCQDISTEKLTLYIFKSFKIPFKSLREVELVKVIFRWTEEV